MNTFVKMILFCFVCLFVFYFGYSTELDFSLDISQWKASIIFLRKRPMCFCLYLTVLLAVELLSFFPYNLAACLILIFNAVVISFFILWSLSGLLIQWKTWLKQLQEWLIEELVYVIKWQCDICLKIYNLQTMMQLWFFYVSHLHSYQVRCSLNSFSHGQTIKWVRSSVISKYKFQE